MDYVLVQPEQLGPLDQDHFKVLLFVGANQARLSYEMATAIHQLGSKAEYIKISGNGPNALDFHIAFYIGQIGQILSVGASPTRQLSLRPVATGAAVAGNQAAESLWCKGWFSHPANVRALT